MRPLASYTLIMTRSGRILAAAGLVVVLHTLLFAAAVVHFIVRAVTAHTGGSLPELRWWMQSAPVIVCLVVILVVWAVLARKR